LTSMIEIKQTESQTEEMAKAAIRFGNFSQQVNDHEKQMRNDRHRGKRMLMSPGRLCRFALSAQP